MKTAVVAPLRSLLFACILVNGAVDSHAEDVLLLGHQLYRRTEAKINAAGFEENQRANVVPLPTGGFVVAWHEGTPSDCYARVFDDTGNPASEPFSLHPYGASGWQYGPSVAALQDGAFVATWGGASSYVHAQRFEAAATPSGGEINVAAMNAWPALAAGPLGDFLVAIGTPDSPVLARRYNAEGESSDLFEVGPYVAGWFHPSVAYGRDGRFAIAWPSSGNIWCRAYAAGGIQPRGSPLQANTDATWSNYHPSLQHNSHNDLWVAWSGSGTADEQGVFLRHFSPDGQPYGAETLVNADPANGQALPNLGIGPNDELIVGWQEAGDIHARLLSAEGTPLGGDFTVNEYTTGSQLLSDHSGLHGTTILQNTNLVVGWAGDGPDGAGVYLTVLHYDGDVGITITRQPESTKVGEGATALLSVTATSADPVFYRWQRANEDLTDDDTYGGTGTQNLKISNSTPAEAGDYRVVIANDWLSVTSQVAVVEVGSTTLACPSLRNSTLVLAESPYRLTCDLELEQVSIEPGVRIEATGNFGITVVGGLHAVGTEGQPILFTTLNDAIKWQGIHFTGSAAESELTYCIVENSKNSGLRIDDATPLLRHCEIRRNQAVNGAGIRISGSEQVTLEDCRVYENSYSGSNPRGGGIHTSAPLVLIGCRVTSNTITDSRGCWGSSASTYGGGIYSTADVVLENVVLTGNTASSRGGAENSRGGGIYCSGQLLARNCVVANNYAGAGGCNIGDGARGYGGGIFCGSAVELVNCIIANNATRNDPPQSRGGGVYAANGSVVNCTVVQNSPGGVYFAGSIANSILWGNSSYQFSGGSSAEWSCIQGVAGGSGNISDDPLLPVYDPAAPENQRIPCDISPCIDAGNPVPEYDDVASLECTICGTSRNDMGAHGGPGGCGSAQAQWSLETASSPSEGGDVSGAGRYTDGSEARITAHPNPGYRFDHWDGQGVADPGSAETTVLMDQDREVVAYFVALDLDGPSLSDLAFNGIPLVENTTVRHIGMLSLQAADPAGVGRVEFWLNDRQIHTSADKGPAYSAFWDLSQEEDGPSVLRFLAYDIVGNRSSATVPVVIALAPPVEAPVITAPNNGAVTDRLLTSLQGTAERYADHVVLYVDGTATTQTAGIAYDGAFAMVANLKDGSNRLSVAAVNRAGVGPVSAEVEVVVDRDIPAAPVGLAATPRPGGLVWLDWWAPRGVAVKGYHIYRSTALFVAVGDAERITDTPVLATSYGDLPDEDGRYYYRVATVNSIDAQGPMSTQVEALSDRIAPRASAEYRTTGSGQNGRYGAGTLTVTLSVTEKLAATPFLSVVRAGATPVSVDLTAISETQYEGAVEIPEAAGTATAYINYSGRDLVGNRGTEVDSGATFVIDTQGPAATGLLLTPSSPIRNSPTSPVTVVVELSFSQEDLPAEAPLLKYSLSTSHPEPAALDLSPLNETVWQGSVTLPPSAGETLEMLSFGYEGVDALGNLSDIIAGDSAFQVYQSELPALSAPGALAARAGAGGRVELTWNTVEGASEYDIYRQTPGEPSLTLHATTAGIAHTDEPPEGLNHYAVAAVRLANGQRAASATSTVVSVEADATPPGAPEAIRALPQPDGVDVNWDPPAAAEPLLFTLYRDRSPINDTTGLIPLLERVGSLSGVDPNPLGGTAYYAVTAMDAVGNESPPSASAAVDISVVPLSSLHVDQLDAGLPVVSWSHAEPDYLSGYNVYVGEPGQEIRVNRELLPNTVTSFTDTGYDRRDRRYSVAAVGLVEGTEVESARRSITLPLLTATLSDGAMLKRGVMNRLRCTVQNDGEIDVASARVAVEFADHTHWSDPFPVLAGEVARVDVPVAGYADLPDSLPVTQSIVLDPAPGEQVTITTRVDTTVGDDLVAVEVLNQEFTRGVSGKARLALHNTSTEEIELVMAGGDGGVSPDVEFRLTDLDGMVYSVVPMRQLDGDGLVALSDGTTVARIAPGGSFTSAWADVRVPVAAADEVTLQVEISQLHFHLGREDHVVLPGVTSARHITLIDTPYYATVTDVSPSLSYGLDTIQLAGQAVDRGTGAPLAGVPVQLILSLRGFERVFSLYSDASGNWAYEFTPGEGEAGVYSVHALHPAVIARPAQGQFEVRRLFIAPTYGRLSCPRNYGQTVGVTVSASVGMEVAGLSFAYEAADQPEGAFLPGISVTAAEPVPVLSSGQSVALNCVVRGTAEAPDTGTLVLRVRSDTPEPGLWGFVRVDFTFGGEAAPFLRWTPNFIETGVANGSSISEQLDLSNQGYADMQGVGLGVVTSDGRPAPDWVFLNSVPDLGTLLVGEHKPVSVTFSPDETVPLTGTTPNLFNLRVTADNHPSRDIPFYVHVDRSGLGNVLFKVMDMFTSTLDTDGNVVQGLAGARIRLVKEEGSAYEANLVTDALGEALGQELPAGRYTARISAAGHNDRRDTVWIKPGMTVHREYTLESQLVTVEWSVRPITIEDRYEIVLTTTYQTDVPAAVVVIDPASLSLPDMEPGEVLNGEFAIINHGLIRAENLTLTLPPADPYYKYEILGAVPTTLEPKQVVRMPYRVTCLSRLAGDAQSGGGGDCRTYAVCLRLCYQYHCSNGADFTSCTSFCFTRTEGDCGGLGGWIGGGVGGGGPGGGGSTAGGWWATLGGSGAGEGGSGGPSNPPQPLDSDVVCWPVAAYLEIWFDGDAPPWLKWLYDAFITVGCSVNCVEREFTDDALDLSVKVPGGSVEVKRWFYGNTWHWEHSRHHLHFNRGPFAYAAPVRTALASAKTKSAEPKVLVAVETVSIEKAGATYYRISPPRTAAVFVHANYTITETNTGYLWEDSVGNWKDYDEDGFLLAYGTRNATVGTLLYAGADDQRIVGIADKNDRQVVWFEYDGDDPDLPSAARDLTGRRVEYAYTGSRLTEVRDALGAPTTYDYDSRGRMTRKVDAGGRPTLASYDAQGNVSAVVDRYGNGHFFKFNYDARKREYYAQIRTTSGRVREVWFDETRMLKRVDVNGRTVLTVSRHDPDWDWAFAAPASLRIVYVSVPGIIPALPRSLYVIDEKGNKTSLDGDQRGNLTRVVYPDGSSIATDYEPRFSQPVRRIDQRGTVYSYQYDAQGNRTGELVIPGGGAIDRARTFTYDGEGQLLSATVEADANTEAATVRFAYDDDGNLASIVDATGNTTRLPEYDVIGNPLRLQDPVGREWQFAYDALGRPTSSSDPAGNTTTYGYDGANNLTNVVNALLESVGFGFDDHNNLVKATDPLANTYRYQYNTDNLLTRRIDPDGKELARLYDNEGRVLRDVDGAGNRIAYRYDETDATPASSYLPVRIEYPTFARNLFYDEMQRLVRVEDELGGGTSYSRAYAYDAAGNLVNATDAEGNTTQFQYDALNRLVQVTDPADGVRRSTFDDRGNMIAVEDANGGVTRYKYDRNNRLTTLIRPLGQETTYEYDASGDATAIVDGKGQKLVNEFDERHLLVRRLYYAAGDDTHPVKTITFAYNAVGSLLAWDDGEHSAAFTYDDAQRKTSESVSYGPFTLGYSYTYYANGLKKSFAGSDGLPYHYIYDANNRLSTLTVPGIGSITWDSFSWNSPTRATLPGGGGTEFAYDPLMRLKSMEADDPAGAALMSRDYQYSAAGNILSKATEHGTYAYGYNNLYRLTSASNPSYPDESYTYDAVGNRTSSANLGGAWNYNLDNELLDHPGTSFTYDANGNLIRKSAGDVVNYVYDVADRLIRVEDGSASVIAEYGYDPFGRRLWKQVGGIRTYFLYTDEGLVGEFAADGTEIASYGYIPDSFWSASPIFQHVAGEYYWYDNDHLGAPQQMRDQSGNVVWAGIYDSFGSCHVAVESIANNLRFPGQYWDAETGLHYNWYRYYDPGMGRYLRRDPLQAVVDPYGYAYGNPLVYEDPDGRCVLRIAGGLGEAVLGFLAWETGWGVLVGFHGLDTAWAGVQSLRQGRSVDSYTSQGLQGLGLPPWAANLVDAGFSMGGSYAASKALDPNKLRLASESPLAAKTSPKWPKTAQEMDDFLKVPGQKLPDGPTTPGRDKTVWRPNKDTKITLEQHPYDTTAPDWHKGLHWHLDTPGIQPHQRYVPGDDIPGY